MRCAKSPCPEHDDAPACACLRASWRPRGLAPALILLVALSVYVAAGPLDESLKERVKPYLEGATIDEDGAEVLAYTKPGKSAAEDTTFGWFEPAKIGDASFVCGTPKAAEFGLKLAKEVCGSLTQKP